MRSSTLSYQWTTCYALSVCAISSSDWNERSRDKWSQIRLLNSHTLIIDMWPNSFMMGPLPTVTPNLNTSLIWRTWYIRKSSDSITTNTIISSHRMREQWSWSKSSLCQVFSLTWFRFVTSCQLRSIMGSVRSYLATRFLIWSTLLLFILNLFHET